jgi:hypothetical protein
VYQNFYYSIFIWSSTCFGRHTAHHQEPKTALKASGFSHVEGCWTCSCWTASTSYTSEELPRSKKSTRYTSDNLLRAKTQRLPCSFRLLMMGGVSPETCWASYKYRIVNNLIYYCVLLDFSLWTWNLNFAICDRLLCFFLVGTTVQRGPSPP